MHIIAEIVEKVGLSEEQARYASEILLEILHKRLVEYRGLNGDYLGEMAHWELSNKAFFHLLGFVEQFSKRYQWDEGAASEYLARLGSREQWEVFSNEIASWKWPEE